jgi:hypothetical protein
MHSILLSRTNKKLQQSFQTSPEATSTCPKPQVSKRINGLCDIETLNDMPGIPIRVYSNGKNLPI